MNILSTFWALYADSTINRQFKLDDSLLTISCLEKINDNYIERSWVLDIDKYNVPNEESRLASIQVDLQSQP